jgi:hypothetical protein
MPCTMNSEECERNEARYILYSATWKRALAKTNLAASSQRAEWHYHWEETEDFYEFRMMKWELQHFLQGDSEARERTRHHRLWVLTQHGSEPLQCFLARMTVCPDWFP